MAGPSEELSHDSESIGNRPFSRLYAQLRAAEDDADDTADAEDDDTAVDWVGSPRLANPRRSDADS